MDNRWSINIDIEGFSNRWDKDDHMLWSLGELMKSVHRVSSYFCPESPDRFFAHQAGDAFFLVSEFHEESLERAATIAVALMRNLAAHGSFAKATLAEGEISDINGCYPREVTSTIDKYGRARMGGSLMTIFPVMGTAIINAVAIAKNAPRGPSLTLAASNRDRIPATWVSKELPKNLISLNWTTLESPILDEIQRVSKLRAPSPLEIKKVFEDYCSHTNPPADWILSAQPLFDG